jgi:hypothetical protein
MGQAELLAIAEQSQKFSGVVAARDDEDFPDSRMNQSFYRVINHRFVENGQQMLVCHLSQRQKPGPKPSSEHDSFQKSSIERFGRLVR